MIANLSFDSDWQDITHSFQHLCNFRLQTHGSIKEPRTHKISHETVIKMVSPLWHCLPDRHPQYSQLICRYHSYLGTESERCASG